MLQVILPSYTSMNELDSLKLSLIKNNCLNKVEIIEYNAAKFLSLNNKFTDYDYLISNGDHEAF